MKSGPTLHDATSTPRARNAAISPVAIVVFPTPECVPATTNRGTIATSMAVARLTGESPSVGSAGRSRATPSLGGSDHQGGA
jgi:hypothetical protein